MDSGLLELLKSEDPTNVELGLLAAKDSFYDAYKAFLNLHFLKDSEFEEKFFGCGHIAYWPDIISVFVDPDIDTVLQVNVLSYFVCCDLPEDWTVDMIYPVIKKLMMGKVLANFYYHLFGEMIHVSYKQVDDYIDPNQLNLFKHGGL